MPVEKRFRALKNHATSVLWAVILLAFPYYSLDAQRVVFSDPGTTYNDTDGPTLDSYGPVNISTCSSVRFEMDFSFSLPWEGSGNMETSDECAFTVPPCPGNPMTPLATGCGNCWDFLWAQFFIDGAEVGGDLIGEAGTTNAEQSGSIFFDYCTMGMAATAQISVTTQTWAADEAVTFSNIMIICYEGIPNATANPNPICDDEDLNLNGNVIDPGVVSNSTWTGPGTIADPTQLSTTVTNIPPGPANYTLTVTDDNGCMVSDVVMVTVHPTPMAFPAGPLEECDNGSGQAIFDLTQLNPTITGGMGGTVLWYRDAGLSNLIANPAAFLSGNTTVYVIIDNGFCQSEVIEVELIVLELPDAFDARMEVCEDIPGSGVGTFNLFEIVDDITGGSGFMVNFFQDPAGMLPINAPYITSTTTIYATVSNGMCESEIVEIRLIVHPSPGGNDVLIEVCEDFRGIGFAAIDLDDYRDQITVAPGVEIDFFEDNQFVTEADNPYDASVGTTILYARVNNGECDSRPIEIRIRVYEVPGVLSAVLEVCENPPGSGIGYFELDSLEVRVLGNQQGVSVTWYVDSMQTTLFDQPYSGGDTTIFAQASNGFCESEVVRVELVTIPKPEAQPYFDTLCADQSGEAIFDLSKYEFIIAGDTSREEVFFASDSLFTNPIKVNFRTGDTTVWARVERGDCLSDAVRIRLVATPAPILSGLNNVMACDSFVLPVIPGINLTGNEAYYSLPDGQGTSYQRGFVVRQSTKMYYYDELKECFDQDSFNIEIVPHPEAGDTNLITVCEGAEVDLSNHLVNGQTGGVFFDSDNTMSLNGNLFNTTGFSGQVLEFKYRVDGQAPCGPDSTVIRVDVREMVEAGSDTIVTLCLGDSIDLNNYITGDLGGQYSDPAMSGGLSGTIWNSLNSGTGQFDITYSIGDDVVCPEDNSTITIIVNPAIVLDDIVDVTACDWYVLPNIEGINANLAMYFTQAGGNGQLLNVGDTIWRSQTVYVFGDETGFCSDEVSFEVTILPIQVNDIAQRLCFEDFITVDGQRYDRNNPNGQIILTNGAANGCDSVVNIDLTFYPQAIEDINRTLCRGQSITVNGMVYDQNNPSGQEILLGGSFRGCDSIINISLQFDDYAVGTVSPTICSGDSILVNGTYYHEGKSMGSDTLPGQGVGGCDSIVNVQIRFYQSINQIDTALCAGESLVINGTVYDESNLSGREVLAGQAQFGCDSIVDVQLTINQPSIMDIRRTLCFGDSLVVNGVVFSENRPSGTEIISNGAENGCDSIINVALDFQATANGFVTDEICALDTLVINGRAYYEGNSMGRDTIPGGSQSGCDSVVIVDLNILDNIETNYTDVLCPEEEIMINGTKYNRTNPTGLEIYPGLASNGCDSVVYVNLTFEDFQVTPGNQVIELELGDSVQLNLSTNFNHDSVVWSPSEGLSCSDCLNPVIKTSSNQVYTVTIYSANGCVVSATVTVNVSLDTNVYVPNSFSPNGDNINDRFTLFVKEGKVKTINLFNVYTRWGELIYSEKATNPDDGTHVGWDGTFDGKRMNPGVYVFQIDLTLFGNRNLQRNGSVTLIE